MKKIHLKSKPAQQLVEFLLVAPFIIIIFGLLTEYAYALNTYMTVQEGLKTVTSQLYSQIKPNTSISDIRALVKADLTNYLAENKVPTNTENEIDVGYTVEGNSAIFFAGYKYIPAFTLPNVYFKLIPDEFNFLATAVVPTAFLGANSYNNSIKSKDLDGIWAGSSAFASLDAFNASKQGIMTTNVGSDPTTDKNKETNMLFLIPNGTANTYAIVDWKGVVEGRTLDRSTGLLSDGTTKFINYAVGKNAYQIVFVHDDEATPANIPTLATYWSVGSGAIADATADGILKRTLALIDINNLSVGNYDSVGLMNTVNIKTFGSLVFVTTGEDISAITSGATESSHAPDYTKNFGTKVP